jgi:hypothetical protein
MLRVMPALEAYVTANIATQNLFGGSPFQFLLGDLNSTSGTGALSQLMGPQPGVLTLAEMVKGEYNVGTNPAGTAIVGPTSGTTGSTYGSIGTNFGTPIQIVTDNFKNNFGNIIVGSIGTTIGFRLANKVLSKPKRKFNAMLKQVGLGSTVQM